MKYTEALKVAVAWAIAEKRKGSKLAECDLFDMKMKELREK